MTRNKTLGRCGVALLSAAAAVSLAGPVDDEDRRFGEGVSACWVAFAKNGVPDCALVPDWPRYQPTDDRLAHLAPRSAVVAGFRKAQLDHLLKIHFAAGQPRP